MTTHPLVHRTLAGLLTGLFFTVSVVNAQPQSGNGGVELSFGYSFTAAGDAEFAGTTSGEVELSAYRFAIDYQRPLSDRLVVGLGLNYQQFELDATAGVPLPETLRGVSLAASGRWTFESDWSLLTIVEPGIFTDTEASSSDGFAVQGVALALRRLSPTLTVGLGLRLTSLGDHAVIPFPFVRWQPKPDWSVALGAPRTEVAYVFDRETTFFGGVSFLGGSFAVDDPAITAPPGHRGLRETELDVREIRVGLGVRRSFGAFRVEIEGGVAVDRSYDYYDRDLEIKADTAGFGRINIVAEF